MVAGVLLKDAWSLTLRHDTRWIEKWQQLRIRNLSNKNRRKKFLPNMMNHTWLTCAERVWGVLVTGAISCLELSREDSAPEQTITDPGQRTDTSLPFRGINLLNVNCGGYRRLFLKFYFCSPILARNSTEGRNDPKASFGSFLRCLEGTQLPYDLSLPVFSDYVNGEECGWVKIKNDHRNSGGH
ncbi:MAG: hypothetical protein WCT10_05945 [Patescibacteria group bacterium]